MAAATREGAAMLDRLLPDIEKAFTSIPAFGSIGFTVHFHDSEPTRIEWSGAISRQVRPKAGRP
jgi:hypothetical protein